MRALARPLLALALVGSCAPVLAQDLPAAGEPATGDWPTYGHDKGGQRHSPLTAITPDNVGTLVPAWTYHMRPPGPDGAERAEWSIGEALVGVNYRVSGKQAAYVYAMAEKRAKDRVILKLIELHGLVYSEEEADEFKTSRPASTAVEVLGETVTPVPLVHSRFNVLGFRVPGKVARRLDD